ncbi:MAG: VacB/RNase II family 3'-5' exoribonuclease [Deltaproteobacteria bacterium]|nr:VacB/RNase II family 3'-5' exoribonuclease [Deltaproteobacteria bacterium]
MPSRRKGGRPRRAAPEANLETRVLAALDRPRRAAQSVREIVRRVGGGRGLTRAVRGVLRKLVREGRAVRGEEGYRLARADGLIEGTVRRGPGRLCVIDDAGVSYRVGEFAADEVGHDDRVLVQPIGHGASRGEIVQILESPRRDSIGLVTRGRRGFGLVPYRDPGESWQPIAARDLGAAGEGDVVVAEPVAGRRAGRGAALVVVEVLGRPGDPEADFRAVAWRHRLPLEFGQAARDEANAASPAIPRTELQRRLDLRERCFLTIDPATARDHDDAVCVEALPGGGDRLYVAIADVSYFVAEGTALDREAWLRGNSVYFPDRAIPMLPERLSGDLCSLRPDVDRMVLVVEMDVEGSGQIGRARLHEAVIRSRARLSYAEAARVMDPESAPTGEAADAPVSADVRVQLERFAALARRMSQRRVAAGALDFELPEPRVVVNEAGRAIDIVRGRRTWAHRAVEEAMLAANREVARALLRAERPTVFRVHESPLESDLDELADLYASQGLLPGTPGRLDSRAIAAALRRAVGRPAERLVHYVTLRAMKQARYSEPNLGHFALAFDAYLHFTSPIRRYADLVVHRAVRALVRGQPAPGDAARDWLQRVAIRTSARERLATAAEREMLDLARCEVMRDRIGEVFAGTIASTAPHGLYVQIEKPFVEGLLSVGELQGWYTFDDRSRALVARESGHRYRLGDPIRVRLASVDPIRGWINFSVAKGRKDEPIRSGRPARPARRKGAPTRRKGRR